MHKHSITNIQKEIRSINTYNSSLPTVNLTYPKAAWSSFKAVTNSSRPPVPKEDYELTLKEIKDCNSIFRCNIYRNSILKLTSSRKKELIGLIFRVF